LEKVLPAAFQAPNKAKFQEIQEKRFKATMSVAGRDANGRVHRGLVAFADRLIRVGQRFITENAEGTVVLAILVAFVGVWMLFWQISTASVDVHFDASEAMVWAQYFAFGYKHPPLTGWLFASWFSVFPRQQWAADLLNVTTNAVALAVTWRLLRDHLDKNRALFGLFALMLIPLYDVKAEVLNANTVMIPFWAAALLFYLRARRGLGSVDAFLAGAFASLTMLGKYWAVFLFVGMAATALVGPGTRRFWRSSAPYVMALGAAVVIAPHVWWLLTQSGASVQFAESVINPVSFGAALAKSANYVLGAVAYIVVPLIFFVALRPGRAALADTVWPLDEDRRQAWILLLVPLLVPALVNLAIPYRLTAAWTSPNWALLPIVLYASPKLLVDERAVARAGLAVLAVTLAILIASPVVACVRLTHGPDANRPHFRQVAERAETLAGSPIELIFGSEGIVSGLPFYLPKAQPLTVDPLSAEGRAAIASHGLLIVCASSDAPCQKTAEAFAGSGARTTTATLTRSFLGFSGPPMSYQITVVPRA
jgi:4-amino-4-deoxy-L-arabinose transferase-like glycosyltransferase